VRGGKGAHGGCGGEIEGPDLDPVGRVVSERRDSLADLPLVVLRTATIEEVVWNGGLIQTGTTSIYLLMLRTATSGPQVVRRDGEETSGSISLSAMPTTSQAVL
jgi:hypothetical protein